VVTGGIQISMENRVVRTAGESELLGSLAVLGGETTDEKLQILEPTHALLLSSEDFESAVADHPEFALAIIRGLAAALRGVEAAPPKTAEDD
jgi:CRP-like cAMP-binding protein